MQSVTNIVEKYKSLPLPVYYKVKSKSIILSCRKQLLRAVLQNFASSTANFAGKHQCAVEIELY